MFSDADLVAIAARAATLDERLAAGRLQPEDPPGRIRTSALDDWIRAVAAGDRGVFERRLAWDGWSSRDAERALTEPPPGVDRLAEEEWVSILARAGAELAGILDDLDRDGGVREASLFQEGRELAFVEIGAAFARAARSLLSARLDSNSELLSGEPIDALERRLLDDLAFQYVLPLFESFDASRVRLGWPRRSPVRGDVPRDLYRAFVRRMLTGGLREFFRVYGALARSLCRIVETWVASTAELVERLVADRADLESVFSDREPLGALRTLRPGLSDRHRGGRQVAVLGFASGVRVVYKPRSVDLEAGWFGFLRWLEGKRLEEVPPPLRVVARRGYGWVEYAEQSAVDTSSDAESYYRKAGGLLAVALLLGGDDLHSQNLVATRRGPVLIDAETILQPLTAGGDGRDTRTVLTSQLLTSPQLDAAGAPCEIGGLLGRGGQLGELRRRVWRFVNSDSMYCSHRTARVAPAANVLLRDGVEENAHDHADALVAGFEETCHLVMRHQSEIVSPEGPLSALGAAASRVLLRTSNSYGVLLSRLVQPRYQREGVYRSFLIEALSRQAIAAERQPAFWPWLGRERREIERLDVPYFELPVDEIETDVGDGARVSGLFSLSGLSAARARIAEISGGTISGEAGRIERVLGHGKVEVAVPEVDGADSCLARAVEIAELIGERQAERPEDEAWLKPAFASGLPLSLTLYDGAAGVGVFFAAVAHAIDSDRYRSLAERAFGHVLSDIEGGESLRERNGVRLGACSGLGGVVYALVLAGRLLEKEEYLDAAVRVAELASRDDVPRNEVADVADGLAGALLGVAALVEHRPESGLLGAVERWRDLLLASALGPNERNSSAGFAHGPAGVAVALSRAFECLGDERCLGRAAELLRDALSVAARGAGDLGLAWCRGVSGLGLALLAMDDVLGSAAPRHIIDDISKHVIRSNPAVKGDVCCGNLGRVEFLVEAGLVIGQPALLTSAAGLVERLTAPAVQQVTGDDYDPGFFCGLAGIGYSLLRLARPGGYPSVAAFRPVP